MAIEITEKIALHVVIGDKTDTDVELVVIIQTEQEDSRIKLREHMAWNSNVQLIGHLGVKASLNAEYTVIEMSHKRVVNVMLLQFSHLSEIKFKSKPGY